MAISQLSDQAFGNAIIEIHRLHDEILSHARTSLDKAIRIGDILTTVKSTLKHGDWLPWIKEHAPFAERTARRYLFVFEKRAELKSANVTDLSNAYSFDSLLNCSNGDREPAQLHEPNFHSRWVKITQQGQGEFSHWLQRRPLSQWATEELFDCLANAEPFIGICDLMRQELSTRPDAPSGYR